MTGFEQSIFNGNAKKPVCLIVSQYCQSVMIRNIILECRDKGVTSILVTCNSYSPLVKLIDYPVFVVAGEKHFANKMGTFASRTSMTYVLDLIYAMIFTKDYDKNVQQLYLAGQKIKNRGFYIDELKNQ